MKSSVENIGIKRIITRSVVILAGLFGIDGLFEIGGLGQTLGGGQFDRRKDGR